MYSSYIRYEPHASLASVLAMVSMLYLSPAYAIECGDTLGPGGQFKLNQDLECDNAVHPIALTILDGARLSMGNHTITCLNTAVVFSTGIKLEGEGVVVQNGNVVSCDVGVNLAGSGKHLVLNMNLLNCSANSYNIESNSNSNRLFDNSATGGDFAFAIFSDDNLIFRNHSIDPPGDGFVVSGNNNRLYRNTVDRSICHGFSVDGQNNHLYRNEATGNVLPNCQTFAVFGGNNKLSRNVASDNASDGFFLFLGDGNRLLGNRAEDNSGAGIHVADTSSNNMLLRNAAFGNDVFDLQDDNPNCNGNTWERNKFETSNVSCIKNVSCMK